ncbi:hypothetical protein BCV70DRAFT_205325 [Testicularia cyperi]|uniref:Uncharacterized protein n=1 Tax=Testicularia cyperi TaxID=1882483 RepID=A0A317XTG9_9BASI|nr:hypothetical protein BCV70DRAFT_205325 [Testicularia cyperi]
MFPPHHDEGLSACLAKTSRDVHVRKLCWTMSRWNECGLCDWQRPHGIVAWPQSKHGLPWPPLFYRTIRAVVSAEHFMSSCASLSQAKLKLWARRYPTNSLMDLICDPFHAVLRAELSVPVPIMSDFMKHATGPPNHAAPHQNVTEARVCLTLTLTSGHVYNQLSFAKKSNQPDWPLCRSMLVDNFQGKDLCGTA